MHEHDRLHALPRLQQRVARRRVRDAGGLDTDQRSDQLQAIADAVADLMQQGRLLFQQIGQAVA